MADKIPYPKVPGPYRCAPCKFATDGTKPIPEQETVWYQHQRDVSHKGISINARCENCGKKSAHKGLEGKVPQPSDHNKNPKHITVFCDNDGKCRTAFLKNLGVIV